MSDLQHFTKITGLKSLSGHIYGEDVHGGLLKGKIGEYGRVSQSEYTAALMDTDMIQSKVYTRMGLYTTTEKNVFRVDDTDYSGKR